MSLSGWDANKKIQCSVPAQPSTLTNFPVLFNIGTASGVTSRDNSEVFDDLGANSKKIAVEIGDTGVQCYVEIERWDDTGETAQLWVKIPSYISTTATILYFYYDSAHADNTTYVGDVGSTPGQAVWDSNFVAVYHMCQDPSTGGACILDSTSNANHGTPQGTPASGDLVDGLIGKAIDFDNGITYITVPDSSSLDIDTKITLESLIYPTSVTNHGIIQKGSLSSSQGVYQLSVATVGTNWTFRLNGSTTEGSGQSSGGSPVANTWAYLSARYDAANQYLDLDGTNFDTETYTSAITTDANNLNIGVYYSTSYTFSGLVAEIRISNIDRSIDWIVATDLSNTDDLITYSGVIGVVINALGQIYNLSDPVLSALGQDYHLTSAVKNSLSQIWAHIIEVALGQYYGDADKILASLNQYYDDAPQIVQALIQKYDDMRQLSVSLEQKYNLMFKAETSLDQVWAICDSQAINGLVQEYDLRLRDEVMAALGQYWGLFRDYQDVQAPVFWVMAEGVLLNQSEFAWTISAGSAAIECSITLRDHGQWRAISIGGALEIHWNGVTYDFFIEDKPRSRAISEKEFVVGYFLKGLSLTAGLEAPYAAPVTMSWASTTMASEIVSELAEGVTVDWQIDDFPVYGGKFNVSNQTPLSAIKDLVGTVGAIVGSTHDSKLIVRRFFKHSPPTWGNVIADHTIYDDGDVMGDSDDRDVMPGYNYVEITDEAESDSSKRLEQEKISATAIRVRGYSVPWADSFPLDTSGGANVSIIDNGIKTEEIIENVVEFVDGVASTSKPVYDYDLKGDPYPLVVEWMDDDLGAVSVDEGGSMTSAVPNNSLAKITYLTKYREWMVQDQEIESVQVFIPGEE